MKSSGKKTRHKLKVTADAGMLFLGLSSPEADYKISIILNSVLNTRFKSNNPLVINTGNESDCSFSRFSSTSEYNDSSFELISNRSGICVIDKKLAGLDYLLIIKGSEIPDNRDELISLIRGINELTAVFVLDDNILLADTILQQIA